MYRVSSIFLLPVFVFCLSPIRNLFSIGFLLLSLDFLCIGHLKVHSDFIIMVVPQARIELFDIVRFFQF